MECGGLTRGTGPRNLKVGKLETGPLLHRGQRAEQVSRAEAARKLKFDGLARERPRDRPAASFACWKHNLAFLRRQASPMNRSVTGPLLHRAATQVSRAQAARKPNFDGLARERPRERPAASLACRNQKLALSGRQASPRKMGMQKFEIGPLLNAGRWRGRGGPVPRAQAARKSNFDRLTRGGAPSWGRQGAGAA